LGKKHLAGVLLINFGGPASLDDVEPFISNILGGRKVPPGILDGALKRYAAIGGGSPLFDITRIQAEKLEAELNGKTDRYRVFFGMLHWHPFIFDTLKRMADQGVQKIFVLSLAPFFSRASTGAYFAAVRQGVKDIGLNIPMEFIHSWHVHPLFVEAVVQNIKDELSHYQEKNQVYLIFSAHSLPEGERGEDTGLYQKQYQETVNAVMQRLGDYRYRIAYQSQGGRGGTWLGPDISEVVKELKQDGERDILIVPAGFVSDHLETLYDLDIEIIKNYTEKINVRRCKALNAAPGFIKALASQVREQSERSDLR